MSSSYITQTSSLSDITETLKKCLTRGIPLNPMPDMPTKDESVPHAPVRTPKLTSQQFKVCKMMDILYINEYCIIVVIVVNMSYTFCLQYVCVSLLSKMHYVIFQPNIMQY